jgi:hypothetical protein
VELDDSDDEYEDADKRWQLVNANFVDCVDNLTYS